MDGAIAGFAAAGLAGGGGAGTGLVVCCPRASATVTANAVAIVKVVRRVMAII